MRHPSSLHLFRILAEKPAIASLAFIAAGKLRWIGLPLNGNDSATSPSLTSRLAVMKNAGWSGLVCSGRYGWDTDGFGKSNELEEITACVEAIFGIVDESDNPS